MALVTREVAAIVRAHSSNFRTVGFTAEVPVLELVELANWKNIPLIDDLGSGALTLRGNAQGGTAVFAGAIQGTGDVIMNGDFTQVLSGDRALGFKHLHDDRGGGQRDLVKPVSLGRGEGVRATETALNNILALRVLRRAGRWPQRPHVRFSK